MTRLLSVSSDTKSIKSAAHGWLTGVMFLEPDKKLCPNMSPGCGESCLKSSGRMAFDSALVARVQRTLLWKHEPDMFLNALIMEVQQLTEKAEKQDMKPCVRLNGTSDVAWEKFFPMDVFPDVQFFDYTKNIHRFRHQKKRDDWPENYKLLYSRSEHNTLVCDDLLTEGENICVVFDEVPKKWRGHRVIDGDRHDLWFTELKPFEIWGVKAKGKAVEDETGFVVRVKK